MPRYIDADKLHYKRVYIEDIRNGEYHGTKSAVVVFADEIDKNKKARVSPDEVRGVGKWIERVDYDWDIYHECSVCHTPFTMLDGTTPELNDYHYCPNCGARMKGVSEDV